MKKKSLLLFVTVLFLTLLAACAPDREENAKKNTDADNESVEKPEELTVWANDEEKQLNAIEKIASDYEKKEGIKVNVVAKSMLDQLQELSDRKSTRLNSSHVSISYAVFCLKKKKKIKKQNKHKERKKKNNKENI